MKTLTPLDIDTTIKNSRNLRVSIDADDSIFGMSKIQAKNMNSINDNSFIKPARIYQPSLRQSLNRNIKKNCLDHILVAQRSENDFS